MFKRGPFSSTTERGFTLLELLLTVSLSIAVTGVMTYTYIAVLNGWHQQKDRSTARSGLTIPFQRVVKDLRRANLIQVDSNHSVRFRVLENAVSQNYVYYLYNAADSWPPAFNQTSYELRRTTLTGGLSGTFTYGSGDPYLFNIVPPPESSITGSGGTGTAVFTLLTKSGASQAKWNTTVKVRNLP